MRRLVLTLVALLSLALPGVASARGGDYSFDGATAAERSEVRAALDVSSFDWGLVGAHVRIHVRRDIVSHSTPGHVWLNRELLASGRFAWATVQDEYAHQLDFFRFDDLTRRALTARLKAKDWCYGVRGLRHADYGCERFSSTLVWSYWQSKDNAYRPGSGNDEAAAMEPKRFRALISELLARR
jgi:hypothetical protein